MTFRLNPELDRKALRRAFEADGRLHVPGVLEEASARRLHEKLSTTRDWVFVFNRGNKHFEVTQEAFAAFGGDLTGPKGRTGAPFQTGGIRRAAAGAGGDR